MDYLTNDTDLKKVADAIRAKGNTTDSLAYPDEFVTAIGNIQAGGGSAAEGDITFYDYEGTIVESWTLSELANKTALPAYPSHEGLICQGWNWSLADLKATNRKMNVGAMYITDDGKTRIYIHLEKGCTSPVLGCCPNGTVTVDWGDGTTPDTLTGTSTSTVKWTPAHNYAAPGDYVIKLTVSGTMGFYGESTSGDWSGILRYLGNYDRRNTLYQNSVTKIEIGEGIASIGASAFYNCRSLTLISIPTSITSIGANAFRDCYSLTSISIPTSVTKIEEKEFDRAQALRSISIPNSITTIGDSAFDSHGSALSITIPDGITEISAIMLGNNSTLASILIPDGVTTIGFSAFQNCDNLVSLIIPSSVAKIAYGAFSGCANAVFYDFSNHTTVPTLINTSAFMNIHTDCEIRVPASLVNEWKAATNWATYADHIVGV